jgi:hypothetical protein
MELWQLAAIVVLALLPVGGILLWGRRRRR